MYAGPEDSPTAVICARIESPKRCGEGGWLHVLRDDGPTWAPWQRSIRVAVRMMSEPSNGKPDFAKLAADFRASGQARGPRQAGGGPRGDCREPAAAGHRLVGKTSGVVIPDEQRGRRRVGHPVAAARRQEAESSRAGKEGLFIPEGIDAHGLLLIAEGPTDTAALLGPRILCGRSPELYGWRQAAGGACAEASARGRGDRGRRRRARPTRRGELGGGPTRLLGDRCGSSRPRPA